MPICIECHYPLSDLYHVLQSRQAKGNPLLTGSRHQNQAGSKSPEKKLVRSAAGPFSGTTKAPEKSISGDVRLTQCPRCKSFADKYVEHDYVVLFIDLVLVKPQVYRHLLFNRFTHDAQSLDPAIRRLGVLLLLFDVYLTMLHIESEPHHPLLTSPFAQQSLFLQWAFFVVLCTLATIAQHLTIRGLAKLCTRIHIEVDDAAALGSSPESARPVHRNGLPLIKAAGPSAISTALFVSSCMSLFPLLMIVWRPEGALGIDGGDPHSASLSAFFTVNTIGEGGAWIRKGVIWAVALQNVEALKILLACGYPRAALLVLVGAVARWLTKTIILGLVGFEDSS